MMHAGGPRPNVRMQEESNAEWDAIMLDLNAVLDSKTVQADAGRFTCEDEATQDATNCAKMQSMYLLLQSQHRILQESMQDVKKKNDHLTTIQVAACETIQRMQKETDDLRKQLEIAQRMNVEYKDLRTQLENAQLQNTKLVTARKTLSSQLQLAQNTTKNNDDLRRQLENAKLLNYELSQRFNGNVNELRTQNAKLQHAQNVHEMQSKHIRVLVSHYEQAQVLEAKHEQQTQVMAASHEVLESLFLKQVCKMLQNAPKKKMRVTDLCEAMQIKDTQFWQLMTAGDEDTFMIFVQKNKNRLFYDHKFNHVIVRCTPCRFVSAGKECPWGDICVYAHD